MASLLDYAPIAAACFAVPEFVPQLRKLAVTGDAAGVSWSWGVLTAVNNAAWLAPPGHRQGAHRAGFRGEGTGSGGRDDAAAQLGFDVSVSPGWR